VGQVGLPLGKRGGGIALPGMRVRAEGRGWGDFF